MPSLATLIRTGNRYNSQASVIIYADSNVITSSIGWLWIRLVSLLSYVV